MKDNRDFIMGRNAVSEALKSGRRINKVIVATGVGGSIKDVTAKVKKRKIPLDICDRKYLDEISCGGKHQGIIAYVSPYEYATVEDILEYADQKGEDPFVIILDGIEDPHNLGAVMRTAECCGAHGVIIPKRNAAAVNETVVKASAGAAEYVKCAKVPNITATIKQLKDAGMWIWACDMDGDTYYSCDMKGKVALVIGSEGKGISRLVKENCDFTVSVPMAGRLNSLNAASAAAVLMYEVLRQRDGK